MAAIRKQKTNKFESEKWFERFIHQATLTSDYLKHIATLDTGLILAVGAFKQIPNQSLSEKWMFFSLILFIISLGGVACSHFLIVSFVSKSTDDVKERPNKVLYQTYNWMVLLSYGAFLSGMLSFIVSFRFT
jgi:hypothetical protein